MKNIDKIRQMSSDELAKFLLGQPVLELNCERCFYPYKTCKDDVVKWLEEESE